ncbi:hypothetical protein WJX84_012307 [Apatococcus fuscideae]|uniref:Uncharacterized protein n=1 Tax=Apatococcus fuscideae TaxID=2026836 RepID=A0AAW1RKA3_9CHLO
MLPSSLSAELDDPFQGMALTSSLDPVLDNQQIGGSTEVAGFKRTPARQAAARRAGGTQRAAAAGQENSLLDVPLHRQSSLTVRPPLVERSSNIQFCSGLSSKTANKLDLRGTTPAATTINLNASRRLERRLAFERTLPYNALEPAVPAAEYQHAATTDKIPSPEAMFVPPVKTFAQVTKNNPDYASPSNCAADVKPGYSCLYPATDAEAVALSNTGFSLWSNSRLPPAYIPTGPLPRPIQHHAPPSVTKLRGIATSHAAFHQSLGRQTDRLSQSIRVGPRKKSHQPHASQVHIVAATSLPSRIHAKAAALVISVPHDAQVGARLI